METKKIKYVPKNKKTHDEFIQEMSFINPNIIIIGRYTVAKNKIDCKCKTCGNEWSPIANNIQQGQGCPACANRHRNDKNRLSQEEVEKRIKKINPNLSILGEYLNAHKRIEVKCNLCNHTWEPIAWDILRGTGCPNCCHTGTSFTEQFILNSFIRILGKDKILSRNRSFIGEELDIFIPYLNLAIEPGSWYWHKNKLNEDLDKQKKCAEKGVNLIIIYDSCEEKFGINNIYAFDFDMSLEKDYVTLKKMVINVCEQYGISENLTDNDWNEIIEISYVNSRMITTEQFKERAQKINNKLTIIGEYKGYNKKIKCVCNYCRREIFSSPQHILENKGCAKCARVAKKTHEEFVEEMSKKRPNIIVKGHYINNDTPIIVSCNECGYKWNARPGSLLYGFGCKKCGYKNGSMKRTLTNDEFLDRMSEKGNKNVEVIGTYINSKTKILCRCKLCKNEWMVTPSSLLQGHGCSKCAYKRLPGRPKKQAA